MMRAVACTLAASLLACRAPAPPVSSGSASPQATADAPPAAPPSDATAAPVDPLALVRERGPLHGAPIHVEGAGGAPASDLVFTGTEGEAWGAWALLSLPSGPRLVAIEDWPAGVRVRFGAASARDGVAYALVETVEAPGRPAGQRSVVTLTRAFEALHGWQVTATPLPLLERAGAITEAAQLLEAAAWPAPTLTAARCNGLRRAAQSSAGLSQVVVREGLAHFEKYPDGLVLRAGVLDRAAVARQPRGFGEALLRTSDEYCEGASVALADEGAQLRVRALVTAAPVPAALPRTGVPAAIAGAADRAPVERYLRARLAGDARVVAIAPITAQGGALAVVTRPDGLNAVVLSEGGAFRLLPLGRAVNINNDAVRDARFVDADGDGRNDVVVESEEDGSLAHRGLYLTPPPSMSAALRYDLASALALNTAADLDAGVASLGAIPWRGVPHAQACALMAATRTPATLRRVATANLRVVSYEEPGTYAWRAQYQALSEFTAESPPAHGEVRCGRLACEADRPVCTGAYDEPGPGGTAYWFAWEGATLKLAGYAVYSGS